MDVGAGTLVTNNVRLLRLLGRGGMGSVWVAEHLGLETEVAVKFITPELAAADASLAVRFKREASAAARIASPHVVRMFDFGLMQDGTPYLVMELLKGGSLREWLDLEQTLTLRRTGRIVAQTAKALTAAHSLGIIHRDIKPDNLFLVEANDEVFIKVLDFGIAKQTKHRVAGAMTSTGMLIGTPEYMSPEQLLSAKDTDVHADLWALAVVAYECLVGRTPFTAETVASLGLVLDRAVLEPPSKVRPELPSEIDGWFRRALARQPSDRFDSARTLASELARIIRKSAPHHAAEEADPASNRELDDLLDEPPTAMAPIARGSRGTEPSGPAPPQADADTGVDAPGSATAATGHAPTVAAPSAPSKVVAPATAGEGAAPAPRAVSASAGQAERGAPSTLVGLENARAPRPSRARAPFVALGALGLLAIAAAAWTWLRPATSGAPNASPTSTAGQSAEVALPSPTADLSRASADPTTGAASAPAVVESATAAPDAGPPSSPGRQPTATAPRTTAGPSASAHAGPGPAAKPDYCKTSPYAVDAQGIWHIKPACL
jgi:eukaryotic-like serine/threonine-protein kinase